ncbi:MAG: NAD(P)-dependent oxidoreductase [Candidatus Puniceispirillaceae bacterium]
MAQLPQIAFIGIGLMGNHMARNLLRAGYHVQAWNRTKAKAEALAADGAVVCDDAKSAVKDADIIMFMVADGPTVAGLLFDEGLVDEIAKGAIIIDMSSIKASEARLHANKLREHGIFHLDAPVSGGTKGAEAASLAIMAGGDEDVFAKAEPVFAPMGRAVHVGPDGAGQLSKLANQAIVGATISVVAEAMLFVEKGGANPAAVRQALKGGFADSIILQQHGTRMTTGDFVPGGPSRFQVKDLDNVLHEAAENDLSLPLTQDVRDRYTTLVDEMDGGDLDHSAIYLELLSRQKG